jgi:hypothetical protein
VNSVCCHQARSNFRSVHGLRVPFNIRDGPLSQGCGALFARNHGESMFKEESL